MKSIYVPFRFLSFMTLSLFMLASCTKTDKVSSPPNTIDSRTQDFLISITNSAANTDAEAAGLDETDGVSCKVITFVPSKDVYPHKQIVDFGSGCVGADGRTRSGRKVIDWYVNPDTAPEGTLISETRYRDFYIDDIKITGFVRTFVEKTGDHGVKTEKDITFKRLQSPDGTVKTSNGTHFSKQIAGYNTKTREDDIFQITGHADGTEKTADGTAVRWASKITHVRPVIRQTGCFNRMSGLTNVLLEFTAGGEGRFLETLNYGNGTCDNNATLSLNGGEPVDITLPLYFWPITK